MKRLGEPIIVNKIKIEKPVYGGLGFGRIDGMVCFVPFSARGDLLDIEVSNGYKLVKSQPIDMPPQTYHIESISLLTT